MSLNSESILQAVRELREYKDDMQFKVALFVQRLGELGIQTINAHRSGQGDSDFAGLNAYVDYSNQGNDHIKATLVLHGKDVAFIEFGAGVHYNSSGGSSPNPYGVPLGMIIGSYGKGHGLEDSWWYKDPDTGQWIESHGTEAAMPMYYADREIRDNFIRIAKEVFK